jgi:hypothetical protein
MLGMATAGRLLGSGTALTGTMLQLAVIAATVPGFPECDSSQCRSGHPTWLPEQLNIWRPLIDNGPLIDNEGEGEKQAEREPQCPAPKGRSEGYRLASAPLPEGYDPHGFRGRALYACVLVARDGQVLQARMLRGTGRPALDSSLLSTIREGWSFWPDGEDPRPASLQRVRLSSGRPAGYPIRPSGSEPLKANPISAPAPLTAGARR